MNIEGKTIWQQAAGDKDRNYVDVCLDWSVILNGPGYAGPLNVESIKTLRAAGWKGRKIGNLVSFRDEMKPGHIVLLKLGMDEVYGVGEIVGDYLWSSSFGDVDGWDIEHVRRVRWLWKSKENPKVFPKKTLKWGLTTQLLTSDVVKKWLATLDIDAANSTAELRALLPETTAPEQLPLERVAEHMFDMGAASNAIDRITHEVDDLVRIYNWYNKKAVNRPSEHETVAYLVVPFLRALGWTPQKMAIEWGRTDVALFKDLPRSEETLACVVEVKNLGSSCLKGKLQAEGYVKKWGRTCNRFVLTDGLRYAVYEMVNGTFELMAYMNLNRRYDEYPIYGCKGICAAIMAMTPEKITDPKVYSTEVEREEEEL